MVKNLDFETYILVVAQRVPVHGVKQLITETDNSEYKEKTFQTGRT